MLAIEAGPFKVRAKLSEAFITIVRSISNIVALVAVTTMV